MINDFIRLSRSTG